MYTYVWLDFSSLMYECVRGEAVYFHNNCYYITYYIEFTNSCCHDCIDVIISFSFSPLCHLPTSASHYTVPSEAPRDFSSSVVNSSAITLQWQSPSTRHHNGALLYFVVYYSSHEDSLQISVSVRNDTTHYEYVVGGLKVYTNYTFTIVARNMAGNGPSSILRDRTQENGKTGEYIHRMEVKHSFTLLL